MLGPGAASRQKGVAGIATQIEKEQTAPSWQAHHALESTHLVTEKLGLATAQEQDPGSWALLFSLPVSRHYMSADLEHTLDTTGWWEDGQEAWQ